MPKKTKQRRNNGPFPELQEWNIAVVVKGWQWESWQWFWPQSTVCFASGVFPCCFCTASRTFPVCHWINFPRGSQTSFDVTCCKVGSKQGLMISMPPWHAGRASRLRVSSFGAGCPVRDGISLHLKAVSRAWRGPLQSVVVIRMMYTHLPIRPWVRAAKADWGWDDACSCLVRNLGRWIYVVVAQSAGNCQRWIRIGVWELMSTRSTDNIHKSAIVNNNTVGAYFERIE